MSTLSLLHTLIGFLAFLLGFAILGLRKGDRRHKRLGWIYVALMGATLASALAVATRHGFPAFGLYAVASLLALVGAVAVSRGRGRVKDWRFWHAGLMGLTLLSALVAFGGVLVGLVLGMGKGPAYYRAFNGVILSLTALMWVALRASLRELLPADRRRRSLGCYYGLVGGLTALVVALQGWAG